MNLLPIVLVNRILEEAAQLNGDIWIYQFKEMGKISRQTRRLCVCCKRRTKICSYVNEMRFNKVKLCLLSKNAVPIRLELAGTLQFQINCDAHYSVKTMSSHIVPGWLGEEDEIRTKQMHLIRSTGECSNDLIISFTTVKSSIDNIANFVGDDGNVLIVNPDGNNRLKSIEALNFMPELIRIYPYEYDAGWVWNNELGIMEFIVNAVDEEEDYDNEDDY
jgi:hypothetical protein